MQKETTLVKPGLYRYNKEPHWLWMRLQDLSKAVGRESCDIWESFFDFWYPITALGGSESCSPPSWYIADVPDLFPNGSIAGKGVLYHNGGTPPFEKEVMVAAGYANNVMRAHRLGITRVKLVAHVPTEHDDQQHHPWRGCPSHSLKSYFWRVKTREMCCILGFNADGKQVHLDSHKAWDKVPLDPESRRPLPPLHIVTS